MNTHQSVKEKELKDQLKKYKINEDAELRLHSSWPVWRVTSW